VTLPSVVLGLFSWLPPCPKNSRPRDPVFFFRILFEVILRPPPFASLFNGPPPGDVSPPLLSVFFQSIPLVGPAPFAFSPLATAFFSAFTQKNPMTPPGPYLPFFPPPSCSSPQGNLPFGPPPPLPSSIQTQGLSDAVKLMCPPSPCSFPFFFANSFSSFYSA